MTQVKTIPSLTGARPILAAIKTVPIPVREGVGPPRRAAPPFLTISRQPGAGAWTLAKRLVERVNRVEESEQRWTCWDRELVEKISADYHISQPLIESLEEASHSWIEDFFAGWTVSSGDEATELAVFRRVATTIRALAQQGRVVIVGRGGVHLTHGMPGGIHVRLVAPFESRVTNMQRQWDVPRHVAAARVREMERNREAFHRRHFPSATLSPDMFAMTLNTAEIDEERLIQVILPLLVEKPAAAPRASPDAAASAF